MAEASMMNSMMEAYNEHVYKEACAYYGDLVRTESPSVFCTPLPTHWRSNESLPKSFKVVILNDVEDGTLVTICAGNKWNCTGKLLNNQAFVKDGLAQFNDLRFVDCSGSGSPFTVSIIINQQQVVIISEVIEITPGDSHSSLSCGREVLIGQF